MVRYLLPSLGWLPTPSSPIDLSPSLFRFVPARPAQAHDFEADERITLMQIATGGLGGLCGSFLYLDSEAPQYPTGYYTSMAVAFVGIASCVVLKNGYTRVNKKRNELTREEIESNWNEEKL